VTAARGQTAHPDERGDCGRFNVILEFEGVTTTEYYAVNKELGINETTGEGEWPDGLVPCTGRT